MKTSWIKRLTSCETTRTALRTAGLTLGLPLATTPVLAQPDYGPAHWNPPVGCSKYYTSGNGHQFGVIHMMQGYYGTGISYLKQCDISVSPHYVVRSSDGDITQMVREAYYAWHARCWNTWMFGTEHEGFVENPAWFTEAMYQSSANLHRHLCDVYGIPKDRNHIIGHDEKKNASWVSWVYANYPFSPTCNTHTDPGQYWNWSHFMALIINNPGGTYWDRNGATAGGGASPSGTWDTTSTNWTADLSGSVGTGPWTGSTAIFSAGSDATGSYTVTVGGTLTVNHLLVQEGTPTFSGGQLNFAGSGTYSSNYVASGRTAIFNTPFGGTAAPDKWGPGTAIYNAASTCGGDFTLNEGTLGFGHNSALSSGRLIIGDTTATKVVTLKSADATARTLGNWLEFYAMNFNIGAGGNLTFTGPVNVGANSLPPTTVAISNSVTTFSGVLTNTAGLSKTGPGTLVLGGASANTYGSSTANGYTTVSGGTLMLNKTAEVAAVASGGLNVNSGGTLLLGAANQVGNSIPMTLGGGTFQTAGFSEQLGTLKLTTNSVIDLGAGASVLKFSASSGVAWTAARTLTVTNWSGSVGGGGADQLTFGSNGSGLSPGQVAQVFFANPAGFPAGTYAAVIRSTGEVVPPAAAPSIAAQPVSTLAVVGDDAAFTVGATGTPRPAYQWRFNGADLPGATAATLPLPGVTLSQAGSYSVVITNVAGSTNSATVVLAVYATAAPTLAGASSPSGGRFQFNVSGVPGYAYAVWGATNLRDWTPLQTNASPFIFTDTNAGAFPARFYRAQWLP